MEKSQVVAADTPVLGDNSGAIQPGATFEPAATAVAVPVATDPAQPAEAAPLAAATTDSPLKAAPAAEPAPEVQPKRWRRPLAIALIVLALTGGGVFAARLAGQKNSASATDATQRFGQQSAPLASLSKQLGQVLGDANVLTVNGQLHVTNNLVLDPSAKPAAPTPGQLYYDQATNSLGYYNGKGFVYLQGGGNTFVTNNITNAAPVTNNNVTNVTNDNITNVTNVTNVTNPGGGFSGTGTAGTIAMFTAPGTLGDSVITQSGTNLTAGSLAGASATTIQGGTGNILIATAPNAGTGGGITIQTGDSSTNASGDVTVDTGAGVINGTVIGNKDFEDGTNDNVVNGFGFDTVIANSTAQAHTGTHSLALTMGNSGSYEIGEQAPYQTLAQPGHSYRFSAWVRAGTTARTFTFQTEFSSTGFSGGGSLGVSGWGSVTDSSGSWKQVSGTLVAPANTYALAIAFTSGAGIPNGEVHYIDDVTVTDLNSASAVSQLNLGAANAQQVTLGNLNQIQPTSIYGAGINMSGGLGVTNITGGSFNLSAAGASTISTGLGAALNITSGGSASWGTAGNLFGSTLTLHSGAAGGNNNGGDLILQSGAGSGTGVSGNITLDASQSSPVSGTLVDDRDFETGTQNLQAGSNTAVAQTNVAVHSGGFSLAATSGAAGNWEVAQDQGSAGVPVTPGHQYYFSAWVRADTNTGHLDVVARQSDARDHPFDHSLAGQRHPYPQPGGGKRLHVDEHYGHRDGSGRHYPGLLELPWQRRRKQPPVLRRSPGHRP